MANDSRLCRRMVCIDVPIFIAIVAAFATVFAPPVAAQLPPPAAPAQGRPQEGSRSVTAGTPDPSASRHPLDPLGAGRDRARGRDGPQGAAAQRQRPVRDRDPERAVEGGRPPAASPATRFPREAFLILLDNATGRGYEAVVDLAHGLGAAVRGAARGRPAADHARRVRRVRGGGQAVAGLPRGAEEAGHRGPQPGHGRRLVGRPLRQRAARGSGASGSSAPSAGSAPSPHDNGYARPDREHRRRRRPQPQGGRPGRGLRRRPAAAPGRQLGARVHQGDPRRPQAAGGRRSRTGRASRCSGHEVQLAEVGVPRRLQPARGAGAPHGRLRRPPRPLSRVDRRDDRALRRPQGVVLSQERLRPGRVRRRHDGQLAGARLRLPGHDPLLRRPHGRQPRPGRHDQERDLPARGRLRHALEAHRLAHQPVGGAPIAPAGRLDGRHRGQLRLWLLLVLLPGRHDPDGGQAHGDHEHDRAEARRDGPLRDRGRTAAERPLSSALSSTPGSTSPSTARTTPSTRSTRGACRPAPRTRTATPSSPRRRRCSKESEAQRNTNPLSARFWRIVNPGRKNEHGPTRGLSALPRRERRCRSPSPAPRC